MGAEKALVTFKIAAIEEFAFSFFSKKEIFFLSFQSLSKPMQLKGETNFVSFILFTGKEGVEIATEALDLGVEYHVDKHGSLEIVFEKLMHYIRMAVENSGTNL